MRRVDDLAMLSRRRFLSGVGGVLGAGVLGQLLTACGGSGAPDAAVATTAARAPGGAPAGSTVKVSTWPAYVDKAMLPAFEAQAGVRLDYIEDYNDNNEYFAKVQPQLSSGQTIDRDIARTRAHRTASSLPGVPA